MLFDEEGLTFFTHQMRYLLLSFSRATVVSKQQQTYRDDDYKNI